MDQFMDMISRGAVRGEPTIETTVLTLLLAFALGQVIAYVYARTHSGVSYSQTFTQSLVLIAMVVSLALHVIGSNIAAAFGLMGALAIIRFRNVLKDTRDTVFVFFSLVLGMAVGVERYSASLVGTVGLLLAATALSTTGFGSRGRFDGHLSLLLSDGADKDGRVDVLRRFCRRVQQISSRAGTQSDVVEVVLRVRLRDRQRAGDLLAELQGVGGVRQADLVLRDELSEV